jgi:acyl-CoA synthetase (AMP-forming)/AMP-acid ligase II
MKFIDLLKDNKNLQFYDAETHKNTDFNELDIAFFNKTDNKALVFLYLDNSLDAIQVFLTFFKSNHALVLLNPKLNNDFKQNLEHTYEPNYIYDPLRPSIKNYAIKPFINNFVLFENPVFENTIHDTLKVLLSTSGTTGTPKLVKLSEANIIANAQSISAYLPIEKDDVTPLNLSICYSYGLSVFTSNSLIGGTIVCTNKDILSKDFWIDFEKLGCTSLAGVPYVYEMLNRIGFLKKNYPSLRYMTQAGGKLSAKLIEVFNAHLKSQNKKFFVMYGQTEATARMSYLPPQYIETKIDSIGKAISNGFFSIDKDTNELIYKGPNVFGGYASGVADLATFELQTELCTGDMARCDDEGFYYITGRLKRFIKIFGTRTNLDEIESLLKDRFIGNSFIAVGKNDEKLIVFVTNPSISEGNIKDFLKEKMQVHPSIVLVRVLENIPFTVNGKIDYKTIEAIV